MAHLLGAESLHLEFPTRVVLDSVTIGVEERMRIGIVGRNGDGKPTLLSLGANGAGKSTLISLVAGTLAPTTGRVKHGKTVQVAILDQHFTELADIATDRVREVLARTKTTFAVDGKDLTPAELLERLGFSRAHLSARVTDLSGGQRLRLQLLLVLVLLSEPNVLILDEPNNAMGCSFRTPRFYRRGRVTSGPDTRRRTRGRRSGVPCRTASVGRGGR